MKLIENRNGILQLKQGSKIIFKVIYRKGKYNSLRSGLGICTGCLSLSECVSKTLDKIDYMNNDFKKRLVSL